jgi:hypothetical protein
MRGLPQPGAQLMTPCFLTLYVVKVGDGYQIRGRYVYEDLTACYAMTHKHYPSKAAALDWAVRYAKNNPRKYASICVRQGRHAARPRPVPEYPGFTVHWIEDTPGLDTHRITHMKEYDS